MMLFISRHIARLYLLMVLSLLCVTTASAHFKLNLNARIVRVPLSLTDT